jgi:hypothetical protein
LYRPAHECFDNLSRFNTLRPAEPEDPAFRWRTQKIVTPESLKPLSIFSTASGQYIRAMDNSERASPSLQLIVIKDATGRFLGNLEVKYEELRFRLRVLGGE